MEQNQDSKKQDRFKLSKKVILVLLGILMVIIIAIVVLSILTNHSDPDSSKLASKPSFSASLPSVSNIFYFPESSTLDSSSLPESSTEPDKPDVSSQGGISHQAPISMPPVSQGSPSSSASSSQSLPASSAAPSSSATPPPVSSEPERIWVNINTASVEELARVPNVLRVKAGLIVAYREDHGPFASVDELTNVKGIGPEFLELIRPYVYV